MNYENGTYIKLALMQSWWN